MAVGRVAVVTSLRRLAHECKVIKRDFWPSDRTRESIPKHKDGFAPKSVMFLLIS